MNEIIYWIALKELPKIGDITFIKLLKDKDGSLATIFNTYQCNEKLKEKALEFAQKEIETCLKNNIQILKYSDKNYPNLLKQIHSPPPILYYKGDISLINKKEIVSVVGSRNPTDYGRNICFDIVKDLVKFGIVVVSGFARGIDTIAHKAALDFEGETVAILGNGLNTIYPAINKKLYIDIIEKGGLILSEFSLNTKPEPMNFPKRNRIISGISKAVIIVEAGKKSGSLITAEFALNQGREVFAVPGNVYSYKSKGSNFLIKNGAYLLENALDIVNNLFPELANKSQNSKKIKFEDEDLKNLFFIIKDNPSTIDKLVLKTGINISELLVMLSNLQLLGYIKEEAGIFYAAC